MGKFMKLLERIFTPKKITEQTKLKFELELSEIVANQNFTFYLSKEVTNFIVNEAIKQRINERNNELGFLPMYSEKSHQIKLYGYNNSLIQNSAWVNIDDNSNLKLKEDLNFSDADLYFIIKSIFKHLQIEYNNELVIYQYLKEKNILNKSDLQKVIYGLLGDYCNIEDHIDKTPKI